MGEKFDAVKVSPKYENFKIELDGDPVYNPDYEQGVIFEQSPKAGTAVKVGSVVRVKISKGRQTITLPDFSGQDLEQVKARLTEWGLVPEEKSVFSDSVPLGSVVRTVPAEGDEVSVGDTVTVYKSLGREEKLATVPDLEGVGIEDAKSLLRNAKLQIGKITYDEQNDDEELQGLVVSQSPAKDSQVSPNTQVDVVIAGEAGATVRLRLLIKLPTTVNRMVTMTATQDGVEVANETVNPSELKTWPVFFSGEGYADVKIYFDGELYQVYDLDFDEKGYYLLNDYSDEFTE